MYEIIFSVSIKEKIEEEDTELNDYAYKIFNITYAIGCGLAPIIGGILYDNYDFRKTCDIMAIG